MKKNLIVFIIFIFVSAAPLMALAHSPRLVSGGETVVVQNPEISQAFYGELTGQPQVFEINSDKQFNLYVGLLVPKIPEARKDFLAEISAGTAQGKDVFVWLKGERTDWSVFYEPFGGNDYWQGPEFKQTVPAGKYFIKVKSGCRQVPGEDSNSLVEKCDNRGKYVLVVGERESFGPVEILKTIYLLPQIKMKFFGRSPLTAYFNYTGLFLIGLLIILIAAIFFIVWVVKKLRKDNGN